VSRIISNYLHTGLTDGFHIYVLLYLSFRQKSPFPLTRHKLWSRTLIVFILLLLLLLVLAKYWLEVFC